MSDPKIARRMSRSSDEPYLYESFTKAYDKGESSSSAYAFVRWAS